MRVVASMIVVVAGLVALAVNPVTVFEATAFRGLAAYAGLLDLWLLLIAGAAALYLWRGRRGHAWAMAGLIALLGPVMLAGEAGYVYLRLQRGDDYLTGPIAQVYQDDPLLVYAMKANAGGRQELPGIFSADYTTDGQGRRRIEQRGGATGTIHVFGDAYAFGLGVADRETWPDLLAARLGGTANVLNYGVPGYGVGQMVLSLRRHAEEVGPGDLVLFTLASVDLERNPVGRAYVCSRIARPLAQRRFPRLRDGAWREEDLGDACSFALDGVLASSPFPVGFGKLYRVWRRFRQSDAMLAYADAVFGQAEELARARGARFQVVFVATPEECRDHAATIDLARLETTHRSLLPYCPSDPAAAAALQFRGEPHEAHWNARGHQWAAAALHELLADEIIGAAGETATASRAGDF